MSRNCATGDKAIYLLAGRLFPAYHRPFVTDDRQGVFLAPTI